MTVSAKGHFAVCCGPEHVINRSKACGWQAGEGPGGHVIYRPKACGWHAGKGSEGPESRLQFQKLEFLKLVSKTPVSENQVSERVSETGF